MSPAVEISKAAESNWITYLGGGFDPDGPAPIAAQFIGSVIDHGDTRTALELTTRELRVEMASRYLDSNVGNVAVAVEGREKSIERLADFSSEGASFFQYFEAEVRDVLRGRWEELEDGWAIATVLDDDGMSIVTFVPRERTKLKAAADARPVAFLGLVRGADGWLVNSFWGGSSRRPFSRFGSLLGEGMCTGQRS